ncbi:MAG: sigma 54-interacting transcriptional regulator [Terriglobales bacterium]
MTEDSSSLSTQENDAEYDQPAGLAHASGQCGYRTLLEVADLIVGAESLPELFQELAPRVQKVTGCECVSFSLHDRDRNCMLAHYWMKDQRIGEPGAFAVEDCASGWVWQHQETMAIPDLEQEQRFATSLEGLRGHGVRSYSLLPMSTPQHRYGALGLGKSEPTALDMRDMEFLDRVAEMVALAVENQETRRAWEAQQERLQSVVAISQELRSSLEQERLVPIIFANLRRIINYDNAFLGLLEEDNRFLRVHAVDGMPGPELRFGGRLMELAEAAAAQAIEKRKVTFFSGEDLDKLATATTKEMRGLGIESACNVPLLSGSQVLGSLDFSSRRRGAFRPEDAEYLQQVGDLVAAALDNARAYREIAQLKERLAHEKRYLESEIQSQMQGDEIVGKSAALKGVGARAGIGAGTDSTVLITGETGTGKEKVARAIHNMSRRKERNFIKLNCAAIPTGLLESELFGHEKGAFTGAVSQKIGRLELSDKGTLFLDEIGEIPLEMQPKLLRVLQDYEFERLGGTRTIHVDTRLIAATNRDLARAVEEKQFRSDLFYRLHVFPLRLPALRERREDIPLLVRYFVDRCAARMGKRIEFIPDEAIEAMLKWKWPGNIRELENFIERSVILSEGNRLRPPLAELQQETSRLEDSSDDTLQGRERNHIIAILRQTRGLLSGPGGAAARLGMKRTTLQYRMQKLGISRMDYLD